MREFDPGRRRPIAGRVRRRVRRAGGAFLLLLFLLADPAYACPIDCLLHHHADRVEHAAHHDARLTGSMCHHGPRVTAREAPSERALSPQEPTAVPAELAAAAGRAVPTPAPAAPRDVVPPSPPSPPPRA